jgi:DNA-binding PadR family transcriptional regulator
MKKLTINEEIFLISIWHLKDQAYGVRIRNKIRDLTGDDIAFGTLYNTLDHLARKGYVRTRKGAPSATRGGHNKVYYALTPEGECALEKARSLQKRLWRGIPKLTVGEGSES